MKRVLISAAVAAAVAVPAVIGLWGNASFSQAVPVRAPASGQIVAPSPTPTPSSTPATTDDRGGDTPRDQRTEPGDDRDGSGSSGSGSSGSGGEDDHGGHGSDD